MARMIVGPEYQPAQTADAEALIEAVLAGSRADELSVPDASALAAELRSVQEGYQERSIIDAMALLTEQEKLFAALVKDTKALRNSVAAVQASWSALELLASAVYDREQLARPGMRVDVSAVEGGRAVSERGGVGYEQEKNMEEADRAAASEHDAYELVETISCSTKTLILDAEAALAVVAEARAGGQRRWYELEEGTASEWLYGHALPAVFERQFRAEYTISGEGEGRTPGLRFAEAVATRFRWRISGTSNIYRLLQKGKAARGSTSSNS